MVCDLTAPVANLSAADWISRLPLLAVILLFLLIVDALVVLPIIKQLRNRNWAEAGDGVEIVPGLRALFTPEGVGPGLVLGTLMVCIGAFFFSAVVFKLPGYITALLTLLPVLPAFFLETRWKCRQYGTIAVFAVICILQIGHVGEHVAQVTQLALLHGVAVCPPPVDNADNAARAVQLGLRSAAQPPTDLSSVMLVPPAPSGWAVQNAAAVLASCGILGLLNTEGVHLAWELAGLAATLWLLTRYPRNGWLWLALVIVTWHGVEHIFLSWNYFVDHAAIYQGSRQLWATTIDQFTVTAHPAGFIPQAVTFYDAGGKNGILAAGGLVGTLFHLNSSLLARPYLHLVYNVLVLLPLGIAFLIEVNRGTIWVAQPQGNVQPSTSPLLNYVHRYNMPIAIGLVSLVIIIPVLDVSGAFRSWALDAQRHNFPPAAQLVALNTTSTPVPVAAEPSVAVLNQVLLIYDNRQLELINPGSHRIDVSSLVFVQRGTQTRQFETSQWRLPQMSNPPDALAPGTCYQTTMSDEQGLPNTFSECQVRSAWIRTGLAGWFWVAPDDGSASSFEVLSGDKTIATCTIANGRCEFALP